MRLFWGTTGKDGEDLKAGIGFSLVGLVLVAVVPLMVFGSGIAWLVVEQKKAAVAEQLASTARALRVAVDRELISQLKAIDMLATDASLDSDDIARFQDRAGRAIKAQPGWSNVVLIEPTSHKIVASSHPLPTPAPLTSAPVGVDEVVKTRRAMVAGVFASGNVIKQPIVLFLTPVVRNDQVRFVLAAAMNPHRLNDVFVEQRLAPSWTGAIVDNHMMLGGRSRDPERYLGARATPSLADRIAASESGMFSALNKEGSTVYTVFSRSPTTDWSVVIGVPADEVEGPIRHTLAQLAAVGGVLIAFALALAGFVGRGIVRRRNAYESALQDDIGERSRSAKLIERERARLQTILTTASDGIHILDADGLLVEANEAFLSMLGYDQAAIGNLHVTDWDATSSWEAIKARNDDLIARRGKLTFEALHRRRDAVVLDVEISASGLEIDGKAYVCAAARDITERKRASAERDRLLNIIEDATDFISTSDMEGHILSLNDAGARMVGLAAGVDLATLTIIDFHPPWAARRIAQEAIPAVLERGSWQGESALLHRDGHEIPTSQLVLVHRDDAGNPKYLSTIIRDISEHQRAMATLQERERQLRESQEVAKLGSWDLDLLESKLDWSDETYQLFDQSAERFHPSFDEFARRVHPDDRAAMQRNFDQALASDSFAYHVAIRIINDSGRQWVMEAFGAVKRDSDGKPLSIHGTAQDITARHRAEARLRLSASVFANSYDGVTITDANNIIVDVNPAFSRITGYVRDECIGQTPRMLASGRQGPEFYAKMWQSLREHDHWQGEIWNRRKSGEVYAEMLAISVVRDDAGQLQHYIGVFSDISQLKAHEAELHRIAHYDILTGVPNRRLLADRLGQAIARARRSGKTLAVCYLDLDGFKPINDLYGHAAGDQLLIDITERLKDILRAEDTLARLGGDEFVLLFTDLTHFEEKHFVLDRVLAAVNTPLAIGAASISVSASIGVTLYPADDADADTLLRHADQAMYLAKEAGKNRYHLFDPERDRQVQAHRHYLQRLREALDHGEFVLHYQPKVNLVSGAIIGAEALIRWQHPERGLLPPGEFLHYLDGSDLEIAVGEWVIDAVLQQIALWNAVDLRLTVSANVSADHLLKADFADRLAQTLARHAQVAPASLELEILETAALANMDQAVQVLTRCRQLGVHLSLDDFGTGYSSLTYFRNLPVDILKIDQSFVRDMLEDPDDLGIVESVIRLAHAFNRPVIAEGVETLEHGAMLVHLGCHQAQGYGIARPMPAAQMPDWVSQWRSKAAWLTLDNRLNTREDVMLMVAAQRHRRWIDQIAEHLDHPNAELDTSQDSAHCRFGHWYRSSGAARYGQYPEFQAIDPLHEAVHVIAADIVGLAGDDQVEAARKRLPELYATSDQLLAQIELLIQKLAADATA